MRRGDHEGVLNRGGCGAKKFNDDQSAKLTDWATMRILNTGGAAVRVDWTRWLGGGEQSTALNQVFSADSIGEQA